MPRKRGRGRPRGRGRGRGRGSGKTGGAVVKELGRGQGRGRRRRARRGATRDRGSRRVVYYDIPSVESRIFTGDLSGDVNYQNVLSYFKTKESSSSNLGLEGRNPRNTDWGSYREDLGLLFAGNTATKPYLISEDEEEENLFHNPYNVSYETTSGEVHLSDDDEMPGSNSATRNCGRETIQNEHSFKENPFSLPDEPILVDESSLQDDINNMKIISSDSSDISSGDENFADIVNIEKLTKKATPMIKFLEIYETKLKKQPSLDVYLRSRILHEFPIYGRLNYYIKIESFNFEYNVRTEDALKYECDILNVAVYDEPDLYYVDIHTDEVLEFHKQQGKAIKSSWKKIGDRENLDLYILQYNKLILKDFKEFYRLNHYPFGKPKKMEVLKFATRRAITSREMYLKKKAFQKSRHLSGNSKSSEANKKMKREPDYTDVHQQADEQEEGEKMLIDLSSPEPSRAPSPQKTASSFPEPSRTPSPQQTDFFDSHQQVRSFKPFVEKLVLDWKIQKGYLEPNTRSLFPQDETIEDSD